MEHKIQISINGTNYPIKYDFDFESSSRIGNDLVNDIERDFIGRMTDSYIECLTNTYSYRRKHILQLWTSGLGNWFYSKIGY